MIQSIFHTTENENLYVYDDKNRLSMLVHPEFRRAYEKSIDVDPYYLKKLKYLMDHGFFAEPKLVDFEIVDEFMVKESIFQTTQIVFEVTDSCNLNCTYCSFGELYDGFDKRNRKNINTRNAEKLLKYIFDNKTKSKNNTLFISFFGGEPLLNFNFIKRIVELSKLLRYEKELDIEYSMTTNATLIHKHIDFLVANKFRLLISLDGNEKNHSYRVFSKNKKNSFQRVIINLDTIQRDYPEYFSTRVRFNAVLHDRNSVQDIYEFIYTRYHKIPRISELNLTDIKHEKKDLLERMFHSMRKSEAEYHKKESNLLSQGATLIHIELTDFLRHYSINYYISFITALLHNEEKYFPTSTCLPFAKKIFLTNHDKLLPCERINYKYSMGKMDENVLIDIPEITRQYNTYYGHLKKVCQYCYAYRYCGLCLFNIENLDKLDMEEFVCDIFHDQKAFQNKLYHIFSYLEKYPHEFFHTLENITTE